MAAVTVVSRLVAMSALLLAPAGVAPLRAQAPVTETRLQAAIVSKLPQFVDWPSTVFEGRPQAGMCVAGSETFAADLRDLEAGEVLKGHPVLVRRVEREADLDGCHVLFLAAATAGPAQQRLFARASALPILTVSDHARFIDDGGIVRLRMVNGRLGFDINEAVAQRVGLRISSQLLRLAASVKRASS